MKNTISFGAQVQLGAFYKQVICAAIGFFCVAGQVVGFELPVRYKAGALNVTPRHNSDNWVSNIEVRYSGSSTREGFDSNALRTSALDIFGRTNIVRLGFGLEDGSVTPAQLSNLKTSTYSYWHYGYDTTSKELPYYAGANPTSLNPAQPVVGPFDSAASNLVKFTGRIVTRELALNLQQNLFSGFFVQGYMPFRDLTVDDIKFEAVGPVALSSAFGAGLPTGVATTADFVTKSLPAIMGEQSMQSALNTYKCSAVSEVVIGAGWQGFNNKGFGIIQEATGRVFVGGIIPGGGKRDLSYMTGFPLGYDGFWGVHSRIELEVGMQQCFALGAATSVNMFFMDTRTLRVMSDAEEQQDGLLSFAQASARVEPGAVWDVSTYARLHRMFYGLVIQFGYSFSRQEQAYLVSSDDNYLKGAVNRYLNPDVSARAPTGILTPQYISPTDIMNHDERLKPWERHMLHISIGYDFRLHDLPPLAAPSFSFEYAVPLDGRRAMTGNYLGGSAGIQFKMPF